MTYFEKLREGTIIRLIVFFMFKLIFITFSFFVLTLMNPIILEVFEFELNISIINLLSFVSIANLIDLAKYLVFQGNLKIIIDYEECYKWTDRFLRLFLDNANSTIYLFIGSILHYLIFLIYISFFANFPLVMY